jgi:hypothetical protein
MCLLTFSCHFLNIPLQYNMHAENSTFPKRTEHCCIASTQISRTRVPMSPFSITIPQG